MTGSRSSRRSSRRNDGISLTRPLVAGLAALLIGAALVWALRPPAVHVDLVAVARGPMEVTVAAEGMTAIRERFAVTAPLAGMLGRAPLDVGDPVVKGVTVVAEIQPAAPDFLDDRARRHAEAAVTEAEAAIRVAETQVELAEANLAYAETQRARIEALAARGVVAQRILDDARQAADAARIARVSAQSDLEVHRATVARLEALLTVPADPVPNGEAGGCCVSVTAPVSGVVLEVTDRSARRVEAGAPLLVLGDLADMEITVDLLSADAVRIAPGAPARIERWGGAGALDAVVRRIDPAAFTEVSALGIDEQRVPVRLDILSPPEARQGLGDRYRVFARIVVWAADAVVQAPQSAIFRHGEGWAVFRAVDGRAVLTPVDLGRRNDLSAEVAAGLEPGDRVVAWPGARIADGDRIAEREG